MTAPLRDPATPYMRRDVREALGETLRPGGFASTARALELRPLAPGSLVLDVGCGLGASVFMLRERYGLRALGIDASRDLLAESDRRLPVSCADAAGMPVPGNVFDAVFFECSLSLCPNPDAALAEAFRALRPGGALVVSDVYRRQAGIAGQDANGCLRGAMHREAFAETIAGAGLIIVVWEDHSRLLADCAARLAFAGVPASAFFGSCDDSRYCATTANDFGYCLCIAEKPDTDPDSNPENV